MNIIMQAENQQQMKLALVFELLRHLGIQISIFGKYELKYSWQKVFSA